MQFRIVGASRSTGEPVDIIIDAIDDNAARRAADGMGIAATAVQAVAPGAAGGGGLAPGMIPPPSGLGFPGGFQAQGGVAIPPPNLYAQPAGRLKRMVPAIIGGAALVAVVATLWLLLRGGGGVDSYLYLLPDGFEGFMFANIDKVRDTDMWNAIDKATKNEDFIDGLKLKSADVAEMFNGIPGKDPSFTAFRTRANWTLEDMVKDREGSVRESEGFSYIRGKHGAATVYVAKLGSKYYLQMASAAEKSERMFEELLARAKAKKQPKLSKDAARAMSAVSGRHLILLMLPGKDLDAKAIGVNLGSTTDLKSFSVFRRESDAKEFVKQFDEAKKQLKDRRVDDGTQEAAIKLIVGGITVEQSGTDVTGTGCWTWSEVKKATNNNIELLGPVARQILTQ